MSTEIERFTPPRLVIGSHDPGEGYGCALNVLSWEQGQPQAADYPSGVWNPFRAMVATLNDSICDHTEETTPCGCDILCPGCSVAMLDLAHRVRHTDGLLGRSSIKRFREKVCSEFPAGHVVLRSRSDDDYLTRLLVYVAAVEPYHANMMLASSHRVVDIFDEVTGRTPAKANSALTRLAYTAMTAISR